MDGSRDQDDVMVHFAVTCQMQTFVRTGTFASKLNHTKKYDGIIYKRLRTCPFDLLWVGRVNNALPKILNLTYHSF
jgi:hypothetical protein